MLLTINDQRVDSVETKLPYGSSSIQVFVELQENGQPVLREADITAILEDEKHHSKEVVLKRRGTGYFGTFDRVEGEPVQQGKDYTLVIDTVMREGPNPPLRRVRIHNPSAWEKWRGRVILGAVLLSSLFIAIAIYLSRRPKLVGQLEGVALANAPFQLDQSKRSMTLGTDAGIPIRQDTGLPKRLAKLTGDKDDLGEPTPVICNLARQEYDMEILRSSGGPMVPLRGDEIVLEDGDKIVFINRETGQKQLELTYTNPFTTSAAGGVPWESGATWENPANW